MKEPKKSKTRCKIYCRFSPRPRMKAAETETIDIQEELCREYAEKQGWIIDGDICSDEEAKGKDHERPGLWEAVEALGRGWVLLAYKRDRLWRDVYLGKYVEAEVKKRGARIVTVYGGEEGDSPNDKMIRTILDAVDECRSEVDAYRTSAFMRTHQKNKRAMGSRPPYGMKVGPKVKVEVDGRVIERQMWDDCPKEMETLAIIREMRMKEIGWGTIAKRLNDEGRMRRNGKPWCKRTLRSIYTAATREVKSTA